MISFTTKSGKKFSIKAGSGLLVGAFVFAVLFVVFWISTGLPGQAFLLALGFTSATLLFMWISDYFGLKRHRSVHQSTLFMGLKSFGFEPEPFGKYIGLRKKINGGTVRVYYDWDKHLKWPFSFGDIVILVYYEPLVNNYNDLESDTKRIKFLNNGEELSGNSKWRYFSWNCAGMHLNYYRWSKATDVMDRIDEVCEIMKRENLVPLDLDKLDPKLKELNKDGAFLPLMGLVWDELERRNECQAN